MALGKPGVPSRKYVTRRRIMDGNPRNGPILHETQGKSPAPADDVAPVVAVEYAYWDLDAQDMLRYSGLPIHAGWQP